MADGTDRLLYLIQLLGPEEAAKLTRPLTDAEAAYLEGWIEKNMPAHKLAWDAIDQNGNVQDPEAYARLLDLAKQSEQRG